MGINNLKTLIFIFFMLFTIPIFAAEPISDSVITAKVKQKIAADHSLAGSNIKVDVTTNNQVVSLSGMVNSDSEASTLVELAESTLDVKDVDTTNLKVKESKQPFTDLIITAKIRGLFIREKLFGEKDIPIMRIKVETNDGIVYLTGEVDSKEQIENAGKLVKSVSGVKQVRYRIKIMKDGVINYDLNINAQ